MDPPKFVGPKSEAWPGLRSKSVELIHCEGKLAQEWCVGRVGVFERNAVERHRVLAVRETAEVGLALPEADSVGIEAERAGRLLNDFGEIRDRRHEVRGSRCC